jgi:hypothetical protein
VAEVHARKHAAVVHLLDGLRAGGAVGVGSLHGDR